MNYLEELKPGDVFILQNHRFVLTTDFKKTKNHISRLAISLEDGSNRWFLDNEITEFCELFYRDQDNNFLTLKTYDKQNI